MVLTIDGPAASGKTSVAYGVARALGWQCLNTGAMYRAVAFEALRRGVSPDARSAVAELAESLDLSFDWSEPRPPILINGFRPLSLLELNDISDAAKRVASVVAVREALVAQQRAIAKTHRGMVAEGRDQGSVVFPDAEHKFYLTADVAERAARRGRQLAARGLPADVELLESELRKRDEQDRQTLEKLGVAIVPAGALVVDTTAGVGEAEAVDLIVDRVRRQESLW